MTILEGKNYMGQKLAAKHALVSEHLNSLFFSKKKFLKKPPQKKTRTHPLAVKNSTKTNTKYQLNYEDRLVWIFVHSSRFQLRYDITSNGD